MTIEHKNISDASTSTHTPQGFTAASNDTLLTKSSAGALTWLGKAAFLTAQSATAEMTIGHTTDNSTATTMLDEDTYYIIAGTWTSHHADNVTVTGASGRFTVNSGFAGDYEIEANISMISSRSNAVACFSFLKNGAYVAGTPRIRRMIGTGSDVGAVSIGTTFHGLVATDYIQLAFQGITGDGWTDNDTVTVENGILRMNLIKPA